MSTEQRVKVWRFELSWWVRCDAIGLRSLRHFQHWTDAIAYADRLTHPQVVKR